MHAACERYRIGRDCTLRDVIRVGRIAVLTHVTATLAIAGIALGTVLTLVPLVPATAGLVRVWDFPRPQIASVTLISLLLLAIVLSSTPRTLPWYVWSVAIVAALVTIVVQVQHVLPFTRMVAKDVPWARDGEDSDAFSLLICNVEQDNAAFQTVSDLVACVAPDILLLVEVDHLWLTELSDVLATFETVETRPQSNCYGMAIATNLEDASIKFLNLVTDDVPCCELTCRSPQGTPVTFMGVHPEPPLPTQSSEERDTELSLLAERLQEKNARHVIVAGDLNDVAWSASTKAFRASSRLLDPRIGRGLYSTFHARWPLLRWPLDHVFHSEDFALVELQIREDIGSDHYPVHVTLACRDMK